MLKAAPMWAESRASLPTERAPCVLTVWQDVLFTVKVPPVPEGGSLEWQVHSQLCVPLATMLGSLSQHSCLQGLTRPFEMHAASDFAFS